MSNSSVVQALETLERTIAGLMAQLTQRTCS
ncbi:uncharacterized protein METZ01_LOCUS175742, partial [marine metagenome]